MTITYVVQGFSYIWDDIDSNLTPEQAKESYKRHTSDKLIISAYHKYRIIKRTCTEEILCLKK